jgi:hypothetical protein
MAAKNGIGVVKDASSPSVLQISSTAICALKTAEKELLIAAHGNSLRAVVKYLATITSMVDVTPKAAGCLFPVLFDTSFVLQYRTTFLFFISCRFCRNFVTY